MRDLKMLAVGRKLGAPTAALPPVPQFQEKSVTVTENGTVTLEPDPDKDGLSRASFTADVRPTLQERIVYPSTSRQTVTAEVGYDGLSSVTVEAIELPALADAAGPGDIWGGKSLYDRYGSAVTGTLEHIHQPIPVYWDAEGKKFTITADMAALIDSTLALDGAVTGYLVNGTTSIPIPVVLHPSTTVGKWTLTGGITTGSNDDKYITQARIDPATGAIEAEATYYIRALTTLSRNLADWGPEYMSLYLRT